MKTLAGGARLGPYEIVSIIGAGGMGDVYKARDTRLDRTVAIKVLGPHVPQRRFLQEARAVSALNHPNIVILYDIASDAGVDFLVLEYVPGKTLKDIIPAEGLPMADVVEYGVQIAHALGAAHAAGIVHRDIKPTNVIVTPASQIKVLDFGVAKLLEPVRADASAETLTAENTARTEPGLVVGTVSYMSPEQTRCEPLDARSDIFSLGCVLYEAATGQLPFRGASVLSIMHAIATANPHPPSTLRSDLPPEFDFVIERALAKDKDHRYGSAWELVDALQSVRGQSLPAAQPAAEREPEAFVGREAEMLRLREVLRRAVEGSGKILFLTGEPGMGKSALAGAFVFHARHEFPQLLVGRGACIEQYGAGEAYLPFLDALSGLLNGPGRERIMAVLSRHAPTWCLQFPAVFGTTSAFEQLQREAIGATKERMLRELGDALGALASAGPVILLLEDLHWSDPSSIDLLRHLGGRVGKQRLLVIGTLRPDDVERTNHPIKNCKRELEAHRVCEEMPLGRLAPEHIARYLDARFAPNDFPPALAHLIHRKTEGHPLFSAALVQLLVERGDIAKFDGPWTITRPLTDQSLEVPESVRGMIRKKIEALDQEDRRVLQYASIQGEEFISSVLAGMLETDELALEQRLDRLERAHRLIETRGEEELPDGSLGIKYRFAHALYQNILYDSVLTKHRVLLHGKAAETLVRHHGDQAARVAGALAIHFERGRSYGRAIECLIQAADVATERYAGAAAEEHYSHALALLEKLPPTARTGTQISLLQRRGTIRLALGRLADAKSDFDRVVEQARAAGDARAEGAALNALAHPFLSRYLGRADDEMSRAEHALKVAEQTGDSALRAEAMVNLALRHSLMGEPGTAKALFEAAVPLARSAERPAALLRSLTYRGIGHFFQTEFRDAEEMLIEAVDLASRLRDGAMLRTALFFLGWTRGSLGRMSDALATFNELLEMATRNSDTLFLVRVPQRIAWIHHELQDFQYSAPQRQPGIQDSGETLNQLGDVSAPIFSGVRFQALAAEEALAQGDLERATEQAHLLLDNSSRHGPPKYIAVSHQLLAEIATARGDLTTAETELALALEPFRTHPAPLIEWKIYAALGRLHGRKNEVHAAREAFTRAADIVKNIASSVSDEPLRSTFLNAPAVQEVLRGSS